jgi:pimeloyl-ACP methyl ester carboxylesterase
MTPLFFGSAQRRLFGAYDPPRAGVRGTRAALLCNPWGQEYIRAHRSVRRLATLLGAAGCHVLRFDYFGTGDSMGESREVSLRGCEEDIETAIEELRDTSGAARVVLVGMRLGAALATRVATRNRKLVEALVLWDPVVSGPEYLEELLGKSGAGSGSAPGEEVRGFPLSSALANEFRAIDLPGLVPAFPPRTRLIASLPLTSHETLRAELARHGRSDVSLEQVDDLLPWIEYRDYGAGAIPAKSLEAIVRWVS